jgi:hypothetical protein
VATVLRSQADAILAADSFAVDLLNGTTACLATSARLDQKGPADKQ